MDDIEQYISDAIMEKPYGFTVEGERFYLYPATLGKMYLMNRVINQMGINQSNLRLNISMEALRLVEEKKDLCVSLIAYYTCSSKKEVDDYDLIEKRIELFKKELSKEDIASLLVMVLSFDKTAQIFHYLGIDKEQDRMSTVMRVKGKNDKNNISFGGVSVFGTLIDTACERYGWTKEYVVWGIDYTSLRIMLADKITSVYVTDEELKHIPKSALTGVASTIKADDPKNKSIIESMDWR